MSGMSKGATTTACRWLRDMALGAIVFLLLPVAALSVGAPKQGWAISEAIAHEAFYTPPVESQTPPAAVPEQAVVAAVQIIAASDPVEAKRISDTLVLGLTFSLLVACNLAFLRHLRRVSASPRRDEWRRQ